MLPIKSLATCSRPFFQNTHPPITPAFRVFTRSMASYPFRPNALQVAPFLMPYSDLTQKVISVLSQSPLFPSDLDYIHRLFELDGLQSLTRVEKLQTASQEVLWTLICMQMKKSPETAFLNLHRFKVITPLEEMNSQQSCPLDLFPVYAQHAMKESPDLIKELYLEGVKELIHKDYQVKGLFEKLVSLAEKLGPDFFSTDLMIKIEKLSPCLAKHIIEVTKCQ